MYNELKYWNARQNPNSATDEITNQHIAFIKEHTAGCRIILDWGPGVGRIFPAYTKEQVIVGYDIAPQYSKAVKERAELLDLHYSHFLGRDINKVPFPTKSFDAVVSVSVLLHQRDPKSMAREMERVAKKIIVISGLGNDSPHCFNHDYDELFKNAEMLIMTAEYIAAMGGG